MLSGLDLRDDLVNAFFNIDCLASHRVGDQFQLSRVVIEDHARVDRLGLQRRRDAGKVAHKGGAIKGKLVALTGLVAFLRDRDQAGQALRFEHPGPLPLVRVGGLDGESLTEDGLGKSGSFFDINGRGDLFFDHQVDGTILLQKEKGFDPQQCGFDIQGLADLPLGDFDVCLIETDSGIDQLGVRLAGDLLNDRIGFALIVKYARGDVDASAVSLQLFFYVGEKAFVPANLKCLIGCIDRIVGKAELFRRVDPSVLL